MVPFIVVSSYTYSWTSFNSNKSNNQMQQCHKFITWCLCVAQYVSGSSTPIIRSLQLH